MRKPFPEKRKIFPDFPVSLRVMCNDNMKAEFYHVCYDSDIKRWLPFDYVYIFEFNFVFCKEKGSW